MEDNTEKRDLTAFEPPNELLPKEGEAVRRANQAIKYRRNCVKLPSRTPSSSYMEIGDVDLGTAGSSRKM